MPSKLKSSQFSVLCRPLLTATFVLILKQYPRQITGGHDARCRWRNMRTIKFFKGYDSPFPLFHYPFPRQPRSQVLSPTRLSLRRDGWERTLETRSFRRLPRRLQMASSDSDQLQMSRSESRRRMRFR